MTSQSMMVMSDENVRLKPSNDRFYISNQVAPNPKGHFTLELEGP